MKRILFLSILLALASMGRAQSAGTVTVHQDDRVDALIAKQRTLFRLDSTTNGFRIHVFMEIGNEALSHAEQVKSQFEKDYPDIPIYLTYVEPYFRLRAGDFRNRVEAEKCLRRIKPQFKEAFVTADLIYRPKIESYR